MVKQKQFKSNKNLSIFSFSVSIIVSIFLIIIFVLKSSLYDLWEQILFIIATLMGNLSSSLSLYLSIHFFSINNSCQTSIVNGENININNQIFQNKDLDKTSENNQTDNYLIDTNKINEHVLLVFKKVSSFALRNGAISYEIFNIQDDDILLLRKNGLLDNRPLLNFGINLEPNITNYFIEAEYAIQLKNNSAVKQKISYPCLSLTDKGIQLKETLNIHMSMSNAKKLCKYFNRLWSVYPISIKFRLY